MNKRIRTEFYFAGNIRREKSDEGKESRTITGTAIVFGQRSTPLWIEDGEAAYEVIDEGAVTEDTINSSDILLTMFHDRERLLGRCRNGKGTMTCSLDKSGVSFACELADTAIGNEALSAVDRGDISGCSFFGLVASSDYEKVITDEKDEYGNTVVEYHVKNILSLQDFTITPSPAYETTSTEIKRELKGLQPVRELHDKDKERIERERLSKEQVEEMRKATFRPFGYEW